VSVTVTANRICLTEEDLGAIQPVVESWMPGHGDAFTEQFLDDQLLAWETFVNTRWYSDLDFEYNHDIGVRYWIQVAIEHATPETSDTIAEAVQPADDTFQKRMVLTDEPELHASSRQDVFKRKAYFWELFTIMNKN
jgi:hypothetical protein